MAEHHEFTTLDVLSQVQGGSPLRVAEGTFLGALRPIDWHLQNGVLHCSNIPGMIEKPDLGLSSLEVMSCLFLT